MKIFVILFIRDNYFPNGGNFLRRIFEILLDYAWLVSGKFLNACDCVYSLLRCWEDFLDAMAKMKLSMSSALMSTLKSLDK